MSRVEEQLHDRICTLLLRVANAVQELTKDFLLIKLDQQWGIETKQKI